MKRFISLVMCFCLVCSIGGFFVSCEKDEPEVSTEITEAVTEAAAESACIKLSDLQNFVIARSEEGYLFKASARNLKNFINESFSLDVKAKSDFVTSAMPGYEEAEFEILVGLCDREESRSFVSGLGKNDYGYTMIGSKLVISGATEAGTLKAYEHFIENVAKKCEGDVFFDNDTQSYIFRDEYVAININGTPVNEYSIVYPRAKKNSEDAIAKLLCAVIGDLSGYTLEIKTDASEPTGKEIRIGATSRDTAPVLSAGEYFVGNSGDGVMLYAENASGLMNAYNFFISALKEAPTMNLSDTVGAPTLSDELVILDYNVWMHTAGQESRVNSVHKTIEDISPDLMGLQECTHDWMAILTDRFSSEYGIVGEGRDGTMTDTDQFNPILYRKDKFTLIESGTRWLSETPEVRYSKVPDSSYERIFTFAILEEKATGVRFVFISTHFDHEGGQSDQASSFAAYIARFYDMPMLMCGDYNSAAMEKAMIDCGYISTEKTAAQKVNAGATHSGGSKIDYIFTNGNRVTVTHFEVGKDNASSDHYPVVAKIKFLK